MNKLLLGGLLMAILPGFGLAAGEDRAPAARKMLAAPSDEGRSEGKGNHQSRRRGKRPEGIVTPDSGPSGPTEPTSPSGTGGSGTSSGNGWHTFFEPDHSSGQGGRYSGWNGTEKPHYAMPEPSGYPEFMLVALGLATYAFKRRGAGAS